MNGPPSISLFPSEQGKEPSRAQTITAYGVIITAVLGGVSGIVSAFRGAKGEDVREAKSAIVEQLEEQELRMTAIEAQVSEIKATGAKASDMRAVRDRTDYLADWICEENEGKPHVSWPCYRVTWEPPPAGSQTPHRRTNKPWPQN